MPLQRLCQEHLPNSDHAPPSNVRVAVSLHQSREILPVREPDDSLELLGTFLMRKLFSKNDQGSLVLLSRKETLDMEEGVGTEQDQKYKIFLSLESAPSDGLFPYYIYYCLLSTRNLSSSDILKDRSESQEFERSVVQHSLQLSVSSLILLQLRWLLFGFHRFFGFLLSSHSWHRGLRDILRVLHCLLSNSFLLLHLHPLLKRFSLLRFLLVRHLYLLCEFLNERDLTCIF